jgi:hypothetical protein
MHPDSILIRVELWALILTSIAVPTAIIWHLVRVVRISRAFLIAYSLALMIISGFDLVLIKAIGALAQQTSSLADDRIFVSEYSLALYLLPLISATVGINLLSYTITRHLRIRSPDRGGRKRD